MLEGSTKRQHKATASETASTSLAKALSRFLVRSSKHLPASSISEGGQARGGVSSCTHYTDEEMDQRNEVGFSGVIEFRLDPESPSD